MYKTEEGIPEDEARLLLYQWIGVLTNYYKKIINNHSKENIFYNNKSKKLRIIHAWGIDTALYYLLCMKHYKVVSDFLDWDESIFEQYYDGYFDCEEEHVDASIDELGHSFTNYVSDNNATCKEEYLRDDYLHSIIYHCRHYPADHPRSRHRTDQQENDNGGSYRSDIFQN